MIQNLDPVKHAKTYHGFHTMHAEACYIFHTVTKTI